MDPFENAYNSKLWWLSPFDRSAAKWKEGEAGTAQKEVFFSAQLKPCWNQGSKCLLREEILLLLLFGSFTMYWVTQVHYFVSSWFRSKVQNQKTKWLFRCLFVCLFLKQESCIHSLSSFGQCHCRRTLMISWKVSKFLGVNHDKFKHENSTFGGNPPYKVPSLTRSQILCFFMAGMSDTLHGQSSTEVQHNFSCQ